MNLCKSAKKTNNRHESIRDEVKNTESAWFDTFFSTKSSEEHSPRADYTHPARPECQTKAGVSKGRDEVIKKNDLKNDNNLDSSRVSVEDLAKTDVSRDHIKNLKYPVIIKPHDDGCSMGVAKAGNKKELEGKIEKLFASGKSHALIEECITGMELTVGVIGNENPQALPPSQAVATQGILSIQEKFLPGAGENQTPAPLPPDAIQFVQKTVKNVYKTIGCKGYARIDCFYQSPQESPTDDHRCIIIEINTLPGMTPATCIFHQAAELGISPMEFIDKIVQFGLGEHTNSDYSLSVSKNSSHCSEQ